MARACALVGAPVPFEVQRPIKSLGGGLEAKPLREPSLLVRPIVDGRDPTYFEWNGAGCYRPRQQQGSMFGGAHAFRELWYGFDEERLYLRLDPSEAPARAAEVADRVRVAIAGPIGVCQRTLTRFAWWLSEILLPLVQGSIAGKMYTRDYWKENLTKRAAAIHLKLSI